MALVLALIAAATTAGVLLDRRSPELAKRTSDLVVRVLVWVLMPFVVLMVVPHLTFAGGLGLGLVLAYVELALVGTLAFLISDRVLGLSRPVTGSVVCAVILANTGYLGVPLVSALLDHDEIANAVAWDALVSNVMLYLPAFAVGAAFGTTAGESPRERTVSFFTRNPVIYAVVLGFLLPESVSPDALFDIAKFVAGFGVLPLGFFLLGVNLMEEKDELGERSAFPALSKPIALVCGLRLVVAPALLAILVVVLAVDVPDAFYLQAAMPSGINTLVVAHVFGLDLRTAAGAIAWSTMFAVLGAVGLSFVL